MLNTLLDTTVFTLGGFLACTFASLVLGLLAAAIHIYQNPCSKGFAVTLTLLPAMVQMVIMLVNGNLGTGVAVMGAFSLVRFRSIPGKAEEIGSVFLAMAIGLATGTGYIGAAALFVLIIGLARILLSFSRFGEQKGPARLLRIIIPESLDYTSVFDEIFGQYLQKWELKQVKTTNMGSLFRLDYEVVLKDTREEKNMIDDLRCRNGNLEILLGRPINEKEEL